MNPKLFRSIKLMYKMSLVFRIAIDGAILQVKNRILNQIVKNVSVWAVCRNTTQKSARMAHDLKLEIAAVTARGIWARRNEVIH